MKKFFLIILCSVFLNFGIAVNASKDSISSILKQYNSKESKDNSLFTGKKTIRNFITAGGNVFFGGSSYKTKHHSLYIPTYANEAVKGLYASQSSFNVASQNGGGGEFGITLPKGNSLKTCKYQNYNERFNILCILDNGKYYINQFENKENIDLFSYGKIFKESGKVIDMENKSDNFQILPIGYEHKDIVKGMPIKSIDIYKETTGKERLQDNSVSNQSAGDKINFIETENQYIFLNGKYVGEESIYIWNSKEKKLNYMQSKKQVSIDMYEIAKELSNNTIFRAMKDTSIFVIFDIASQTLYLGKILPNELDQGVSFRLQNKIQFKLLHDKVSDLELSLYDAQVPFNEKPLLYFLSSKYGVYKMSLEQLMK